MKRFSKIRVSVLSTSQERVNQLQQRAFMKLHETNQSCFPNKRNAINPDSELGSNVDLTLHGKGATAMHNLQFFDPSTSGRNQTMKNSILSPIRTFQAAATTYRYRPLNQNRHLKHNNSSTAKKDKKPMITVAAVDVLGIKAQPVHLRSPN